MPDQPIILTGSPEPSRRRAGDSVFAWKMLGWLSLVLALAGIGDWVLAWVPLRIGSPEWEFGTVVSSFAGLPLVTLGFAGMLASAVARGHTWQVVTIGILLIVWGLFIFAALVLFLLDVPIALRAVTGPPRLGVMKATAKTAMLGVLFGTAYVVTGVVAVRKPRSWRA